MESTLLWIQGEMSVVIHRIAWTVSAELQEFELALPIGDVVVFRLLSLEGLAIHSAGPTIRWFGNLEIVVATHPNQHLVQSTGWCFHD
jgi:hypothetical protein